MRVTVKLFAVARDAAGQDHVLVELPDAATTVADLRERLRDAFPALAPLLPHLLFAVDREYAFDQTPLKPESEIACIPPVSGG